MRGARADLGADRAAELQRHFARGVLRQGAPLGLIDRQLEDDLLHADAPIIFRGNSFEFSLKQDYRNTYMINLVCNPLKVFRNALRYS